MKSLLFIVLNITSLFVATSVYSHPPELHKKEDTEKPPCEALKKMDHSQEMSNSSIMQTMMAQCNDWSHDMHGVSEKYKSEKNNNQHNSSHHKQHHG